MNNDMTLAKSDYYYRTKVVTDKIKDWRGIKISFQRKAAYQYVILLSVQPGGSLPTLREYSNSAEIQVGNI